MLSHQHSMKNLDAWWLANKSAQAPERAVWELTKEQLDAKTATKPSDAN